MIKFFRIIRQRLFAENKVRSYLLYAVGEIFLVVIGILIALSVSNYNQTLENKRDEAAYLKGIHADLKTQISDFTEFVALNKRRIGIINQILDDLVQQGAFRRNDSILFRLNQITSVSGPTEIKSSFTQLLSSGDLNLIRNDSLKNHIVRFYQELEEMVDRSNSNLQNIHQRLLLPILNSRTIIGNTSTYASFSGNLSEQLPERNYPEHVREMAFLNLENPELELELINALNLRAVIEILQKDRSESVIENAGQLIDRIEAELRREHDIDLTE